MTSIADTLADRQKTHGDFSVQAVQEQLIRGIMENSPTWKAMTAVQQAALHAIAIKLGRILAGNPYHPDHWHDMAGYAVLVEQALINRRDST